MAELTIDELAARLAALSQGRMLALQAAVMGPATADLEAAARANIQARLTMRSRSLLQTVRSQLEQNGDIIFGVVSAGGSYGGIQVDYARLQEFGGTNTPKNGSKHLAIPVDFGLTGPGIAKYRSVRQMPFAAFRPVKGAPKLRWIVYDKRNGQVFFLLVTEVTVPGKYYLRDALEEVYRTLPGRLAEAAVAGVVGEA